MKNVYNIKIDLHTTYHKRKRTKLYQTSTTKCLSRHEHMEESVKFEKENFLLGYFRFKQFGG